jgi:hypothetical protein
MSRYGIDYYGVGKYGNPAIVEYDVSPFITRPVGYGKIDLTWTKPNGEWTSFRLVRNSYGFPVDPDDGDVLNESLKDNSPSAYPDEDLIEGRTYYYSIFVQTDQLLWIRAGNVYGISVKNFNSYEKMYTYLPGVHRTLDRFGKNVSNDPNYVDDQENKDLQDFIKLLAFEYDLEKTLSTNVMYSYDTTFVDGRYIPQMMKQFGVKFEPEIGLKQARILLRNALKIYKTKGSRDGLTTYLKAYTGYDTTVTVGKNLFLDYNNSSFEEGIGFWTATAATISKDSVTPAYVEATAPAPYPNLQNGVLKTVVTTAGTVTLSCGLSAPITRGIPVKSADITGVSASGTYVTYFVSGSNLVAGDLVTITGLATSAFNLTNATVYSSDNEKFTVASTVTGTAVASSATIIGTAGVTYTFSIYGRAATTSRTAALTIGWYNRFGVLLSTSSAGTGVSITSSAWARPKVTATAPSLAAFAVPVVSISSTTLGEIFYLDAAQFEMASDVTNFEEARVLKINFLASRKNELLNPNFQGTDSWTVTGGTPVSSSTLTGVPSIPGAGQSLVVRPASVAQVTVRSENVLNLTPNTTYTFSFYAEYFNEGAGPTTTDAVFASIQWRDSSGNVLKSNLGAAYSHAGTSGWVRPHVTSTAPATFAYATVSVVWAPSSTSVSLVLDQALFEESPFVNTYFDGNTGVSSLANLDWEGTPNLSKSQYYRNREVTEVRLNKDLPNYLTAGTTFQIYFFQP